MSQNVQVTVMPVAGEDGKSCIAIGFHSDFFSQCVYIPYTDHLTMVDMAEKLSSAIQDASLDILENRLVPNKE